jgi:hypothetical protein
VYKFIDGELKPLPNLSFSPFSPIIGLSLPNSLNDRL